MNVIGKMKNYKKESNENISLCIINTKKNLNY